MNPVTEASRWPSSLLVALQFLLIGALLVTTRPTGGALALAAALAALAAGGAIGIAALAANRPGNFNIRPELKGHAQLVTHGIYRHLRHPMYSAVLLAMAAALIVDARPWRLALWIALLAVLLTKANREERYLVARFPAYRAYAARTRRLLPGIY